MLTDEPAPDLEKERVRVFGLSEGKCERPSIPDLKASVFFVEISEKDDPGWFIAPNNLDASCVGYFVAEEAERQAATMRDDQYDARVMQYERSRTAQQRAPEGEAGGLSEEDGAKRMYEYACEGMTVLGGYERVYSVAWHDCEEETREFWRRAYRFAHNEGRRLRGVESASDDPQFDAPPQECPIPVALAGVKDMDTSDKPDASEGDWPGRLYEFIQARKGESVGVGWGESPPWSQLTGPMREECIAVYEFVRAERDAEVERLKRELHRSSDFSRTYSVALEDLASALGMAPGDAGVVPLAIERLAVLKAALAAVHAAIGDRKSHGALGDAKCVEEWIEEAKQALTEFREENASLKVAKESAESERDALSEKVRALEAQVAEILSYARVKLLG